jgi:hypothetical protein
MAEAKYDESQLASQIKVDAKTYMIPVVNFVCRCRARASVVVPPLIMMVDPSFGRRA